MDRRVRLAARSLGGQRWTRRARQVGDAGDWPAWCKSCESPTPAWVTLPTWAQTLDTRAAALGSRPAIRRSLTT